MGSLLGVVTAVTSAITGAVVSVVVVLSVVPVAEYSSFSSLQEMMMNCVTHGMGFARTVAHQLVFMDDKREPSPMEDHALQVQHQQLVEITPSPLVL